MAVDGGYAEVLKLQLAVAINQDLLALTTSTGTEHLTERINSLIHYGHPLVGADGAQSGKVLAYCFKPKTPPPLSWGTNTGSPLMPRSSLHASESMLSCHCDLVSPRTQG